MPMGYKRPLVRVILLAVVLAGCDPTTGMPGQKATIGGLGGAQRTGHAGLQRAHAQGNLCRGVINSTCLEAQPRGIR
jgi:hypothetical protein